MKAKSEKLSEKSMRQLEARIPEYADQAVKQAYAKALSSFSNMLEAVDGKLFESSPDGRTRVIRSLPATTLVPLGSKHMWRITR